MIGEERRFELAASEVLEAWYRTRSEYGFGRLSGTIVPSW